MIYRVSYRDVKHGSFGFSYHATYEEARARLANWLDADEDNLGGVSSASVPEDKQDVLALLQRWASHPEDM